MEVTTPKNKLDISSKNRENDTSLVVSLNKIMIFLFGTLIVGNFAFLWNVNSDISVIKSQLNSHSQFEDRLLRQLDKTEGSVADGLGKINNRLEVFENRITTLEVLAGLKKTQ